jgi:adenosine deaminase
LALTALLAHGSGQGPEPQILSARHFPCKVSMIFVGKRHKSLREMIYEASAASVMRPKVSEQVGNAGNFIEREMARCRVVGFDLAGREFDNPPELFSTEFRRLSRLHIPLTVHAGENAPAQFIEDAILVLQAKRIGHGLALLEDEALIARVREDRVCIELCPVCNHQTSQFSPPESPIGRKYPLRRMLDAGIVVTLNTDNPVISNTNLVKEYLQASYAHSLNGLTLWDVLAFVRSGLVCSFLSRSERRALIQIVEQHIVDLLGSEDALSYLRDVLETQRGATAVSYF